jgi:hypothetical protein
MARYRAAHRPSKASPSGAPPPISGLFMNNEAQSVQVLAPPCSTVRSEIILDAAATRCYYQDLGYRRPIVRF